MGIRGAWQRVGDGEIGAVVFVGIVLCLAKVFAKLGGRVEEVGTYADKLDLSTMRLPPEVEEEEEEGGW